MHKIINAKYDMKTNTLIAISEGFIQKFNVKFNKLEEIWSFSL